MSNPIEDLTCDILAEKDAKINELEALAVSLRQQLKVARETIESYQKRTIRKWRDEHDYLDYEDDRR